VTADIVVDRIASATVVVTSATPVNPGQSVTFTATVTPALAAANGTVQFQDNGSSLGSAVPLSAGTASLSTSSLSSGSHTITALYSGNTLATPSAGTVTQAVRTPVTLSVGSSANPAIGRRVTISVTVGNGIATGTLTFKEGATTLDASPVSAGAASFTTTAFTLGTHTLTVEYGGDNLFAPASADFTFVVGPGVITATPASLQFAASKAGPHGALTAVTPPQDVSIVVDGPTPWTAVADQPWLRLTSASGIGRGAFTVAVVNPNDVIAGSTALTATVTVTSETGLTSSIPVTLTIDQANSQQPPIGVIDTPQDLATGLQGSIAVTGWAIDDVGVDRVEIWRDPVAGETTEIYGGPGPGTGKVFIATATFVRGARPDIVAAFPGYANVDRAGWGYLLLTYGLPNRGNGTYRLYAIAFDADGVSSTVLGAKTISVDNAHATKPFGTIDTPGLGATSNGTVINFGWALTPGSTCVIPDSNVQVSIDSGPLQSVTYGDVRPDIAGAFSGYTNAAAGGGHFVFDSSQLSDGVHTIGWLVTDSCGRAEGVGSRFFTVLNGATAVKAAGSGLMAALESRPASVPREWGLKRNGAAADLAAAEDGTRIVRMTQTERIDVQLPGDGFAAPDSLPAGSSFDPVTGVFRWQPAPGFFGVYDLSFTNGSSVVRLRVIVGPSARVVVDAPGGGSELSAHGFTIGGWAADLASLRGSGIDTVHVWAYAVEGSEPVQVQPGRPGAPGPVFVGAARVAGARPDVARLFGESFAQSGFTLTGTLPPGVYDLVVSAHSAAADRFDASQSVRVTVK
jgi:hypothetical protein